MRTHVIAFLGSILYFSATLTHAGSATSSFRVTATVDPACTIQATPLTFGHYDALTKHSTAPLDVNGTVTITCSKGMVTRIALDPGRYAAHAVGTTRAMKLLSGEDYLNYELYQDVVRTTLWGSTGETLRPAGRAGHEAQNLFHLWENSPRPDENDRGVRRYHHGDRQLLILQPAIFLPAIRLPPIACIF